MSSRGSPSSSPTKTDSPRRRPRRIERSSTCASRMGLFDILNVKSRAMTPPRPMPLLSYPMEKEARQVRDAFGKVFEEKAFQVAAANGIPESEIGVTVTSRVFRDDPSDFQTAVLIVVDLWTEDSPNVWEAVIVEVKRFVDETVSRAMADKAIDISVEMIALDLVKRKYLSPLPPGLIPSLEKTWPNIKRGVYKILDSSSCTAGHVTFVVLTRIGIHSNFDNPTTVYIAVDYGSSEAGWPPVVEELTKLVDGYNLGLKLLLEHNEVRHPAWSWSPAELTGDRVDAMIREIGLGSERRYATAVRAGVDISASTSAEAGRQGSAVVGTLGCWLEVKLKRSGWKTVGLTTYHVIRSSLDGEKTIGVFDEAGQRAAGEPRIDEPVHRLVFQLHMDDPHTESARWEADRDGLEMGGSSECLPMEHPSRAKHECTVHQIKNRISQFESAGRPVAPNELKQELEGMASFFDTNKQRFGRPWLASGYLRRTQSNGRLDWALIEPESSDRVGGNPLPLEKAWEREDWTLTEFPLVLGGTLNTQTKKIKDLRPGEYIYKTGAATKCTVGVYNGMKADCVVQEERYMTGRSQKELRSEEYVFLAPRDKVFCHRGDAGSVVWDQMGGIMGLVIGTIQPQQSGAQGWTLVTPIEGVFDDIVKKSGGTIEEVRVFGAQVQA